jgi:hypothetical protein
MEVTKGKQIVTGETLKKGSRLMVFLNRIEKERRVKVHLELGKSTREIADEVHMSFRDIGSIRRRLFGETEAQTKNKEEITLSTDTKVFKMFEQGKTPIEVSIELDLKSDSVARLYREWSPKLSYLCLTCQTGEVKKKQSEFLL